MPSQRKVVMQVGTTMSKKKQRSKPGRRAPQRQITSVQVLRPVSSQGGMGRMISAPVSMSRSSRGSQPRFASSGNGMRIKHSEYILDLLPTGGGFEAASYPINPGVGTIFRWLSSIANRFNSYKIHNLSFSYEAKCATSQSGSVIIAVNYDASDPIPTTKSEVNAYQIREDVVPWQSVAITCNPADCNGSLQKHYVRDGLVPNTDIKTYDVGNFIVCTQGVNALDLGELFVSYDIEFFSPIDNDPLGGTVVAGGTISDATPLGTTQVNSGSLPFVVSLGNTLTFSQGFQGLLNVFCSATGCSAPSGTSSCTFVSRAVADGTSVLQQIAVQAEIGQTLVLGTYNSVSNQPVLRVAEGPYDSLQLLLFP